MLSINELQVGKSIIWNDKPFQILHSKHLKLGRGGAIQQVKMKSLIEGTIINQNFKGNDKIEEADLERKSVQYLYKDEQNIYFMDMENYEQGSMLLSSAGKPINYVPEGEKIDVMFYKDSPVSISVPIKTKIKIKYCEPGIKGNRESAGTKSAMLETNSAIQVPLFIKTGDLVIVDTRTGTYVERAK